MHAPIAAASLKNKYEKLSHDAILRDNLSKVDIRDNVYKTKPIMDIELVSKETVETLFKYVGMEPGDMTQYEIERKLN